MAGSSVAGSESQAKTSVPPFLGVPPVAELVDVLLELEPPQAARTWPRRVADRPTTPARTSSSRRVRRPARASLTR